MPTVDSHPRIVLAEDNPGDVKLVREALARHEISCDLQVIADGEEAMKFFDRLDADRKAPCPDLLLLDLHLPKRDGEEILKHVRSSERCGQTPVVVLTSSESAHDKQYAEKNAVVHYFRKPPTLSQYMQLGTIVKELIGRASSQ